MIKRLGNNRYTKPSENQKKNKDDIPWTAQLGRYLSATTQYLSIIGAGGLLGWFLDRQFQTSPIILITGVFGGSGAGLYYLIHYIDHIQKKTDD
ncbi:AtpZ/AtpI family protein [candidate division KSB1 bacterium]|nr:AtpZ/AtpI family protein [candidate division KSB1 bacterium]